MVAIAWFERFEEICLKSKLCGIIYTNRKWFNTTTSNGCVPEIRTLSDLAALQVPTHSIFPVKNILLSKQQNPATGSVLQKTVRRFEDGLRMIQFCPKMQGFNNHILGWDYCLENVLCPFVNGGLLGISSHHFILSPVGNALSYITIISGIKQIFMLISVNVQLQ